MISTSDPAGAWVLRSLIFLLGFVALLLLPAGPAVAQADCTAASSLKVTERKNEPPGGQVWFWTLAITNTACTPSSGNYEYELVYKGADGKTYREARSGRSWDTADSQNGSVRTDETLRQGASNPQLENPRVTSCTCT